MNDTMWDAFQEELAKVAGMKHFMVGKRAGMARAQSSRGFTPKTRQRVEHFRAGAGSGEQSSRAHFYRGLRRGHEKGPLPMEKAPQAATVQRPAPKVSRPGVVTNIMKRRPAAVAGT